jgi:phosphoglycolate phosphatase-like HAD superfamily hydrolase
MIVFDVDGTLIGGESADWASFGAAFEEVAGFVLNENFFESIEEVTAQAIVHQALGTIAPEERRSKERAVCQGYLRRLRHAYETNTSSFTAIEGAPDLLRDLKGKGIPIAIATGDWRETTLFKLRAARIPFDDVPLVTSSEFYSRADIIAAAVAKAGCQLHEALYIGDGLWDLRASRKLGIPFIGVGYRIEKLRNAGAAHILPNLSPIEFWRVRNTISV